MENKHKNKHFGILILIGFILIIAAIVTYIVINYNSSQAEIKKRMNVVIEEYDSFKKNVEAFNNVRDNIYSEVMQDTYYQSLKDNDANYKKMFDDYKLSLESIDNNYKVLKDKCINVLYPDVSVNNKCEAFVIGYEEVVNTFISDVLSYNNKIDLLNSWIKENTEDVLEVEKIKIDRDYLDINGDREYNGKKEIKNSLETEEKEGNENE